MFNVYLDDGNIDMSQLDDICYIVNKEGTFLRKKIGITDALVKVNNISHLKSSISSFGKINIPKIPGSYVSKLTKFFKWAYDEYNGESIVLIYYDPELNDFEIFPTDQEVSGASASYTKEGLSHTGYLLVGTIHSHANFGASHSGVDDDDELNFDGVHVTIGNVNDTYQSISCSVVVNGNRFIYDAENYLEGIIKINNQELNNQQKFVKDNRYLVSGLTSEVFPDEWKDKVQKRIKPHFKQEIFNSYLFKRFDLNNANGMTNSNNIMNYGNQTNNIQFDKSLGLSSNPCENCIYRDYKSQMLLQEIFDEDDIADLFFDDDLDDENEEEEST